MADLKTPWRIERGERDHVIFNRMGEPVFYANARDESKTEMATLIVKAVNIYDAAQEALKAAQEALEWIRCIADTNFEQDEKLRAQGARTLRRIADKCDSALSEIKEASDG